MSENDTNHKIVLKLIEITKNKSLKWKRITELENDEFANEFLRYFLNNSKKMNAFELNVTNIAELESYYTKFSEGFFLVLKIENKIGFGNSLQLAVQSNPNSKVNILDLSKNASSELKRLSYYIEEIISDNTKFLDSFLKD